MKKEAELDIYFYWIGWCCILGIGIVGIIIQTLGTTVIDRIPKCFFHLVTGYYCPGCGGTRAVREMMKGHFFRSLYYNPFVGYVTVIGSWFMCSQTIQHLSKGRLRIALHFRQVYMWIGIFLIIMNCLIKNGIKLCLGISLMQ